MTQARGRGWSVKVLILCAMVCCGERAMLWHGMACCGMVWYGILWYGMVWYNMLWQWDDMVWYNMLWQWDGHQHPCIMTSWSAVMWSARRSWIHPYITASMVGTRSRGQQQSSYRTRLYYNRTIRSKFRKNQKKIMTTYIQILTITQKCLTLPRKISFGVQFGVSSHFPCDPSQFG